MITIRKILYFYILLLFILINNSAFGSAGLLEPLSETDITIKKLVIDVDHYNNSTIGWDVNVKYIFENTTEPQDIKLKFSSNMYKDSIKNFNVYNKKNSVPYTHIGKDNYNEEVGEFFREDSYIFKVHFPKGTTQISHTYSCKDPVGDVPAGYAFYFRWYNKKKWKGPIEEISIRINWTEPTYISSYNKGFQLTGKQVKLENYKNICSSFIQDGNLVFNEKNYEPKEDIMCLAKQLFFIFMTIPAMSKDTGISIASVAFYPLDENKLSKLNKWQLIILRNSIFAWHGQIFKNEELNDYFKKQYWYFPREDIEIDLNEVEMNNLRLIEKYEMR